jgi:hypothetical protein
LQTRQFSVIGTNNLDADRQTLVIKARWGCRVDWQRTLNRTTLRKMMPSLNPSSPQVRNAKTPAERMRLFRRRRKFQWLVVTVEVDPREVDALIDRGYLEPKDRGDREALAAAVTAFFSDARMTP